MSHMAVTCDDCSRAVYMPGPAILRQLLEYGSLNYCPPCEAPWRTI